MQVRKVGNRNTQPVWSAYFPILSHADCAWHRLRQTNVLSLVFSLLLNFLGIHNLASMQQQQQVSINFLSDSLQCFEAAALPGYYGITRKLLHLKNLLKLHGDPGQPGLMILHSIDYTFISLSFSFSFALALAASSSNPLANSSTSPLSAAASKCF